ncbi:MAG TPA: ABC transporter ATP-binding protein [Gemmatimonadaceae bacterium]|nr:ABC transporter ATP-binding protein [Gemmatimonadaceae bacterium]
MRALRVRGLTKTYLAGPRGRATPIPALREVNLDVEAGEIVGVVGQPGSGKSTLLLCLAGLLKSEAGTITWFGEQITGHHVPTGLAYVPQRAGYYSFLTVREALEYYATLHDLSSANRATQVDAALHEVALHVHAGRRVSHLSASLLQRLGLAQALIGSPRAILLDETLWGEGLLFDNDIVRLLRRLSGSGVTVLISAPNAVELHRVAERVVMIAEGRVVPISLPAHRQSVKITAWKAS